MAQEFDPYHRWLGIPLKHQPPDYYRLLALERFEDDEEVIRDAVEQRIAHVRNYRLGEHAELAQQLLNELGRAKAYLLDNEKRAEYDLRLRTEEQFLNAQFAGAVSRRAETTMPPTSSPNHLRPQNKVPQRDRQSPRVSGDAHDSALPPLVIAVAIAGGLLLFTLLTLLTLSWRT